MFNFISSRKNAGKVLSSFVVLACAAFVLCVASCKEPDDTSAGNTVYGTWTNEYEKYEITTTDYDNYYFSSSSSYVLYYSSNNVTVSKTSDTTGYIYFQFDDSKHIGNGASVGQWYVMAYKDLTESSISLLQAYSASPTYYADSLENAKSNITIDNGFFSGTYSECTKQ